MINPEEIGGWITSAVLAGVAMWQKRKADIKEIEKRQLSEATSKTTETVCSNSQTMLAAKDDLIKRMEETLCEYQKQLVRDHTELKDAREYWHAKNEKDQALILKIASENSDLRAKTDLTPVLKHLEQVLKALNDVAVTLSRLAERLNIPA